MVGWILVWVLHQLSFHSFDGFGFVSPQIVNFIVGRKIGVISACDGNVDDLISVAVGFIGGDVALNSMRGWLILPM